MIQRKEYGQYSQYNQCEMEEPDGQLSSSFFVQLKATLIRNLTRKKRNKRHTLRELLGPIYFLLVIIVLKLLLGDPLKPAVLTPPGSAPAFSKVQLISKRIAVAPNSDESKEFMKSVQLNVPGITLSLKFYQDEEAIYQEYENNHSTIDIAVIFDQLNKDLKYKIRMSSTLGSYSLPPATEKYGSRENCRNPGLELLADGLRGISSAFNFRASYKDRGLLDPRICPISAYWFSGFSTIQTLIEHTWIRLGNTSHQIPDLQLEQLPKAAFTGSMETILRSILPLYMTISMSQFLTPMLMVVVLEKEKKIKESLRMVGLRDSVFWLSWFLVYGVLIFVIAVIGSLLTNYVVFNTTKSYLPVVFILMFEFGLSIIMFAFVMTALFSKAKTAGISGGLTILMISFLYYLQVYLRDSPTFVFWLLGLLSPTTFAMSMDKILTFDIRGVPLSSEVFWSTGDIGIPLGGAMIMLGVDTILYGFLAAWLDNIIPSEYGTNRPPWFCFLPSYWISRLPKQGYKGDHMDLNSPDIEPVPQNMIDTEAIVINNLKKSFKGWKKPTVHAVNGVSLKIYPGEITAILGHNGAGKTTLFNMLTGMTAPSGGSAHIFGYDISDHDQMEEIRRFTGICPQHDVLFDELTPREHLRYFGRIRGIAPDNMEKEVDLILEDINLSEKGDSVAEKLSGGQKRKLSVGIALIGDPKLIFLDEPTAGVDPYSRRHLWNVLKKRKEGKVILLTTHFMDEADILADRKAIISKGSVRCYGSSLFLKNRFGIGYHLTIVTKGSGGINNISNMVMSLVPGAELARHYGKELSYVLPRDKVNLFPSLFKQIESRIQSSEVPGISNYGVSMTTLEEVFLHLGEEEEEQTEKVQTEGRRGELEEVEDKGAELVSSPRLFMKRLIHRQRSIGAEAISDIQTVDTSRTNEGYNFESISTQPSSWQTYKALLYIRFIRKFREPSSIFVTMILPLIYVSVGVFLTKQGRSVTEQDSTLDISSKLYSQHYHSSYFAVQDFGGEAGYLTSLASYLGSPTYTMDTNTSYAQILDLVQNTDNNRGFFNVLQYSTDTVMSIFNDTAQHSIPVIINTLSNAYAMEFGLGSINLTSQPFRLTSLPQQFDGGSFGAGMLIGLTYILIPIGLALELIEDRETHAKNQLRVNGLSFIMYFGTFFTVMVAMLLVLLTCLLCLVVIFDVAALMIPSAFFVFSSLYLLYTFPALLFGSCVSYLFDTLESGQFLFPIASYAGFIPYIAVFLCDTYNVYDGNLALGLHIVCAFLSPVYIPFGAIYFTMKKYVLCTVEKNCDSLTISDYMDTEIWILYVAIIFHILLWSFVLKLADFLKDGGKLTNFFAQRNFTVEINTDQISDEDSDVAAEREKVADYFNNVSTSSENPVIAVQGLRKVFTTGVSTKQSFFRRGEKENSKKIAVRNLSLSVNAGEVFGLLGHNGAGKTTTMRIITAEEAPTAGKVRIGSRDIVSNQSEAFRDLGYCPQFDAVWKTITVEEHLCAYAAIRGVPPSEIKHLAERYMAGLRIQEHAAKYSKDCSGGTKRKLSYGMSMLGNPQIVLLDEPSTGMDPQSKRFVWNTIQASFQDRRGAILTTHSMEEADALCSRIGIMVKGELRCLGTTQQLKNKYGAGYILEVKWKQGEQPRWEDIETKLKDIFPKMVLNESFSDRRSYNIPQSSFESLSQAFQRLESCKSEYDLEDYSFSQTTLEQVFIEFAKQQEVADQEEEEDREARNGKNKNEARSSVKHDETML